MSSDPEFRQREVICLTGFQLHRMAYTEWGRTDNPEVVVCVHGLTRNSRDFDELARALGAQYRVICPDVAGRGLSEWLTDPAGYAVPVYAHHMMALLARLDVPYVHWVGTSMGGLIGMALASLEGSPVRSLVLNDVGPVLDAPALARIGEYVGRAPLFASVAEAEAYVRLLGPGFGVLDDAAWRQITQSSIRQDGAGWRMRYDPAIGDALRATLGTLLGDLWYVWERITCPVLVLRGEQSDLLSRDTVARMSGSGPCARSVEILATGHAPMLMKPAEISLVSDFLKDFYQ